MKISSIFFIFLWCFYSAFSNASILTLIDHGGTQYQLHEYLGEYANNQQYSATTTATTGQTAQGLVFYDPLLGSFKILTFENEIFWGASIEGHWVGSGTQAYSANNNNQSGAVTLTQTSLSKTHSFIAKNTSNDRKISNNTEKEEREVILTLVDHDATQYQLHEYIGDYANNQQFTATITYSLFGNSAQGLVFYDPFWNSFKILAFENELIFGSTIEGHWTGDSSEGFLVGNAGNLGRVILTVLR